MGTRNVTCIKVDGEIKVAKYCQWDGYPSGQGINLLEILKSTDLEHLTNQVKKVSEISEDEFKECWTLCGANPNEDYVTMDVSDKFKEKYPHLHRDMGAKIVTFLSKTTDEQIKLNNDLEFASGAGGGFGCEYVYLVDLDENKLEVYGGTYKSDNLLNMFDLKSLPEEDLFLKSLNENVED